MPVSVMNNRQARDLSMANSLQNRYYPIVKRVSEAVLLRREIKYQNPVNLL